MSRVCIILFALFTAAWAAEQPSTTLPDLSSLDKVEAYLKGLKDPQLAAVMRMSLGVSEDLAANYENANPVGDAYWGWVQKNDDDPFGLQIPE